MNRVPKLEELIGKSIIIEIDGYKLISGKLVDYTPGDEYVKFSKARVLGDFEKEPSDMEIAVSDIKKYQRKIEINRDGDPFYPPKR